MSYHNKETYAEFLECDWWKRLSRAKRNHVGKCEECGSKWNLQSHHKRYPINLFDTTFNDLKVLCRSCHEKQHGIVPANGEIEDSKIPASAFTDQAPVITTWKELQRARSQLKISREEYDRLLPYLRPKPRPEVLKWKKNTRKRIHRRINIHPIKIYHASGFNCTPRHHWTNRGTSSN